MKKIEIKHQDTGDILACVDSEDAENEVGVRTGEACSERVDLSGVDLSGYALSGADLSGANLCEADFSQADLTGADLSGANISEREFGNLNSLAKIFVV